jgi:hypothetical protein
MLGDKDFFDSPRLGQWISIASIVWQATFGSVPLSASCRRAHVFLRFNLSYRRPVSATAHDRLSGACHMAALGCEARRNYWPLILRVVASGAILINKIGLYASPVTVGGVGLRRAGRWTGMAGIDWHGCPRDHPRTHSAR